MFEKGKSGKIVFIFWESFGYLVGGKCWFCGEESWKRWMLFFIRRRSIENGFKYGIKEYMFSVLIFVYFYFFIKEEICDDEMESRLNGGWLMWIDRRV